MAQLINLYGVQTLTPTTDNNFSLIYDGNVRSENNNEVRLLVDTSQQVVPAPVNIYLPSINSFRGIWTLQLYVVDISGTAGTNAINIIATGGDNVDGVAQTQVASAYGNCVLTIASLGYWTTYGSASGGGSGGGGGITLPYADFFNLIANSQLVVGQTYRINDYRCVNMLNGITQAENPFLLNPLNAGIMDMAFTPYDSPTGNNLLFVEVLPDNTIFTQDQVSVVRKLDVNGNFIDAFNNVVGLPNSDIYSVAVQNDGKILVGGSFTQWGATPVGRLVRLNVDGTLDATFNTNLGSGFDNSVKSIKIQSDGKILVGGFMLTLNANPIAPFFTRLNANGTLDVAFNGALGTGFDNQVNCITIQGDGNILIGGAFTSLNGNLSNYLIRIDSTAVVDAGFIATLNFGGGFNSQVIQTIEQPDTSILVLGFFNLFNGIPYNSFLRIDTFGNDDFAFNGNTGTGLAGFPERMALQNDGSILIAGNYTAFNGNNSPNIVRVDTFGSYDATFSSVFASGNNLFYVGLQSSGKIIVAGNFQYLPQKFVTRLIDVVSTPDFDFNATYTSPAIETLVVKALTTSSIEQVVFSEQFPDDIIEYIAECNTIGKRLSLSNGVTLPDSTILAGLDIQWDGTNAYFNMPTGYPAQYGHYFYIYANFYGGIYDFDILFEPLKSGINEPTINYGSLGADIEISSNQTKVILFGLTQADVLNYTPNSLFVETIEELAPAYGCISKRTNTLFNVTTPFDYRGIRYRRYQFNLSIPVLVSSVNFGVDYWGLNPQTLNATFGSIFTGLYADYGWGLDGEIYNFTFEAIGGADGGYWYMGVDNNVCLNDSYRSTLKLAVCYNNTFGNLAYTDLNSDFLYDNIFASLYESTITAQQFHTNFIYQIDGTTINGRYFYLNSISALSDCIVYAPQFYENELGQTHALNTYEKFFVNNQSDCFVSNNTFGYLNGNIIQTNGSFSNNTFRYAEFNSISSIVFNNNTIETCNNNVFTNTSFVQLNILDVGFNSNTISSFFTDNSIGSNFSANTINAQFQRNTFLEEAIGNTFNTIFQDNDCGSKFNGNQLTGFIVGNKFGYLFNSNQIVCNNFNNNSWIGTNIQGNLFTNPVANITNNFISATFSSNQFSGSLMDYNTISGFGLSSNLFQGTLYNNVIFGGMVGCTTGVGSTFQKNTINDFCNGIDFSLATHVYQTYNCTIQEGNLNNTLLSYLDEATSSYLIVLPTA